MEVYPDGDAWEKCLVEEKVPLAVFRCQVGNSHNQVARNGVKASRHHSQTDRFHLEDGQRIQKKAYDAIMEVYPDGDAWEKCLVEEKVPYVPNISPKHRHLGIPP
jgi:hypothetical protein